MAEGASIPDTTGIVVTTNDVPCSARCRRSCSVANIIVSTRPDIISIIVITRPSITSIIVTTSDVT